MKKNILFFLVILAVSYGVFTYISSKLEPENIVPVAAIPVPTPEEKKAIQDSLEALAIQESLMEMADTTIYTKDEDGYYDISWKQLSKVDFNEIFVDSMEMYIPYPVFHPDILFLDGKKIKVKGYVIPIEETEDESLLILSAFPFSNCFFCGNAGPETVMDIKLNNKKKHKYKQDKVITFKGELRLNDSDLYYLNYILENASED